MASRTCFAGRQKGLARSPSGTGRTRAGTPTRLWRPAHRTPRSLTPGTSWTGSRSGRKWSRDAPGDPRVGVTGASYGGALALLLAGYDERVDALVPVITGNDLEQALFPNAQAAPSGAGRRLWRGHRVLDGRGAAAHRTRSEHGAHPAGSVRDTPRRTRASSRRSWSSDSATAVSGVGAAFSTATAVRGPGSAAPPTRPGSALATARVAGRRH